MKVVLFCGGLGLRMREVSQTTPKPMISVGGYPIMLHVMKYYASFGHTDFLSTIPVVAALSFVIGFSSVGPTQSRQDGGN